MAEETTKEKEIKSEVVAPTVEPKYPPGFDRQVMSPILDLYLKHRGASPEERERGGLELAWLLHQQNYNPAQQAEGVKTYLEGVGTLIESMPEADPILKSSIATKALVQGSKTLEGGDDLEDRQFMRVFNRAILAKIVGSDNSGSGNREVLSRLEKIEGKLELQEILTKFAGKPEDLAEALEKHARVHTSVQAIAGEENTADFKMQALRTLSKGMSMVKKGMETKEKPPRQEVQQIPPRVEIPIPVKPQPLAQNPARPARTPVEVQPAQPAPQPALEAPLAPAPPPGLPETVRLDPGEIEDHKFGLWKPKK